MSIALPTGNVRSSFSSQLASSRFHSNEVWTCKEEKRTSGIGRGIQQLSRTSFIARNSKFAPRELLLLCSRWSFYEPISALVFEVFVKKRPSSSSNYWWTAKSDPLIFGIKVKSNSSPHMKCISNFRRRDPSLIFGLFLWPCFWLT